MIAAAEPTVKAHCPGCRATVDLPRSRMGVDVRCPRCRTWFYVQRERRRRVHRTPRTNQLLFLPPAVPIVVDRKGSGRVVVLCLLAVAVLALAIAVSGPATRVIGKISAAVIR